MAEASIVITNFNKYDVKANNDSKQCCIAGICETTNGQLLIADYSNSNVKLVKLMNDTYMYEVVYFVSGPTSMCSIDTSLVAVALNNSEVHFIRVTNNHLNTDKKLKFEHKCWANAHHQGNLYITDGSALYRYSVEQQNEGVVSKMRIYRGESNGPTVTSCAVSPDGARIYVANEASKQLVTLSKDGKVISTLTDPALHWGNPSVPPAPPNLLRQCDGHNKRPDYPPGTASIHVTDTGQVLVGGAYSNIIIQVDKDGKERLAEVVSTRHGVTHTSVFYSNSTGSLIVGTKTNEIIVFNTK